MEGTSWFYGETQEDHRRTGDRTVQMLNETRIALLAVALHKGKSGDEVWAFADHGMGDGEMWALYEAAKEYGIDIDRIKPYPCGPEPDHHDHLGKPHLRNGVSYQTVTRVVGKESECEECTEEPEES